MPGIGDWARRKQWMAVGTEYRAATWLPSVFTTSVSEASRPMKCATLRSWPVYGVLGSRPKLFGANE